MTRKELHDLTDLLNAFSLAREMVSMASKKEQLKLGKRALTQIMDDLDFLLAELEADGVRVHS